MDPRTWLIHGDEDVRPGDSIAPSIAQGVNWAAGSGEEFAARAVEPLQPDFYNRHGNVNHDQAAALITRLEGTEKALMTASGMGAMTTTLLALLQAGDHLIGQHSAYGGVLELVTTTLPRFGVECTLVDQKDVGAFEAAIRPTTRLILLESPSNPLLEITDLRAVAELARAHGIGTIADNTFATPINQRPHELGVDLVMHSATKYLGGHADLMGGLVTGDAETITRIWHTAQAVGSVLAPFNAWLLIRGLRTLPMRVAAHNANGLALARALAEHPAVARVHHPGLSDHPGHAVAAQQMDGFGGMLSLEFEGGYEAAETFIATLRLAHRAASLGSVESLVAHPAAMWAATLSPAQLADAGVSPGLVRFSAGVEHTEDLVADALEAADRVAASAPV